VSLEIACRKLIEVPIDGGPDKLRQTRSGWLAILSGYRRKGLIVIAGSKRARTSQILVLLLSHGEAHRLTSDFNNYGI
jgi:hypothetical protein